MMNVNTTEYWNAKFRITKQFRFYPFKRLLPFLPEEGKMLDVGCALGEFCSIIKNNTSIDIEGLDFSFEAIHKIPKDIRAWCCDFLENEFVDKSFDIISCVEVLEHIENYKEWIKELKRLSNIILISVPAYDDTQSYAEHINYFTPEDLKSLFKPYKIVNSGMINEYTVMVFENDS